MARKSPIQIQNITLSYPFDIQVFHGTQQLLILYLIFEWFAISLYPSTDEPLVNPGGDGTDQVLRISMNRYTISPWKNKDVRQFVSY